MLQAKLMNMHGPCCNRSPWGTPTPKSRYILNSRSRQIVALQRSKASGVPGDHNKPTGGLSDQLLAKYAAPAFLQSQSQGPSSSGPLTKAVGVDYGTRKTGVAVKHARGLYKPYKVFDTPPSSVEFASRLVRLAVDVGAGGFVVGLPEQEEQAGRKAWSRVCRNFALTLALAAQKHQIRVFLYDERMTTYSARVQAGLFNYTGSKAKKAKLRKKEEQLDALAALVLLQKYDEQPDLAELVQPGRRSKSEEEEHLTDTPSPGAHAESASETAGRITDAAAEADVQDVAAAAAKQVE